MLLKLAIRELSNRKKFTTFFLLNIAFGLCGFMLMQHFRISFDEILKARSKNILGADIAIKGRGVLSLEKLSIVKKEIGDNASYKKSIGMFTMASHKSHTRLVWLSAMEDGFPFYGGLELEKSGEYPGKAALKMNEVWIYPELKLQLDLKVGDEFNIGSSTYKVADIITNDSGQTFQMGAMAPKVVMSLQSLKEADLMQKGSSVRYGHYFKFSENPSVKELQKKITALLDDNSLRVQTPQNASDNVGRVVGYLNDFLGLVTLVAFLLATIGTFYLYRSYMMDQRYSIATLHSLGLKKKSIIKLYLIHLCLLAILGSLIAVLCVSFFVPLLLFVFGGSVPLEVPYLISLKAIILGLTVGFFGCLFIGVPLLLQRLSTKIGNPFHQIGVENLDFSLKEVLLFLPWSCYYIFLSIYVSNSFKLGALFSFVFLGIGVLLFPCFVGVVNWAAKKKTSFSLRFIIRDFKRFKVSSVTIFLSLVMGSLLLTLIPNLESSLLQELENPKEAKLPSLFLFDIQEEQVDNLVEKLNDDKSPLKAITPMVRARLLEINGEKIDVSLEKGITREEERERRFRNRGVNLTYRTELGEGEKVIKGKFFKSKYEGEGTPEISIEKRYASRLGIEMGDKLTFNILGMPLVGVVTSFRSVKWTTFMPNFFIVFQPGVLEDAPKTYLGVVGALITSKKESLMASLYKTFPNVSSIDVTRLIQKILTILDQMRLILQGMSILSVLVGFFVISALVGHQANARKRDWALLKMLGLPFKELRKIQTYSILILAGGGTFLGILLSYVVGYLLSFIFFDGLWNPPILAPFITWILLTGFGLFVSELAVRRVMRVKPLILLHEAR